MKYTIYRSDDCDKSIKVGKVQVLCYTKTRLDTVSPRAEIVGEVVLSDKKKPTENDDTVIIGKEVLVVREPGKASGLTHRTKGYVAVGENKYIRILESRVAFLIALLAMVLIAAIAVVVILALPGKNKPEPVQPNNPLPVIDPYAENDDTSIADEPSEEAPEGGGSVDIMFTPRATLSLETGEIKMRYTNPKNSSHDVIIQLYVVAKGEDGEAHDYLIAQSGRIPHGNKLEQMKLVADKNIFGGEGMYEAKYKVLFYDPDTGEQALIDNELTSITLKVYNE